MRQLAAVDRQFELVEFTWATCDNLLGWGRYRCPAALQPCCKRSASYGSAGAQELQRLGPGSVPYSGSARLRTYETVAPPRLLLAADALANALAAAALLAAALAWRGALPGAAPPNAWLVAAAGVAGVHFLACYARGRGLLALATGLWWEDAAGRCAGGGAVLGAHAVDGAYTCATLGLGVVVSLALRCWGGRSVGERAMRILPVCELVRELGGTNRGA